MSHYAMGLTAIRDVESLVLALQELGFHPEVHVEPQPLVGWRGDLRPERAHVIVRRAELTSASNDIGFVGTPRGIEAIVSEYDRASAGYGEAWLRRVTQLSAVHALLRAAARRGLRAERRRVGSQEQVRVYAT